MRIPKHVGLAAGLTALLSAAGCGGGGGGGGTSVIAPPAGPELGESMPGLTIEEQAAFDRGRKVFSRRFKPSEGLGPFYNATSCVSCHSSPVAGGGSKLYRNFYICLLYPLGFQVKMNDLPSPVIPAFGSGAWGEIIPAHAGATFTLEGERVRLPDPDALPYEVTVAQRNAIPIFGTGMFEFITNETIIGNSDPHDINSDGISGRYNTDDGLVGRFGVKAQVNNLEVFTRAPLQNQMGVTSDPFLGKASEVSSSMAPFQGTTNPNAPTTDNDGVPDPEISHDDLGDLIAFTRFLAPPTPKEFTPAALNGEAQFETIGCTACHIPSLPSTRGPVNAYSDLLLHAMGTELADGLNFGTPQFSTIDTHTNGHEYRTQPLWGVSMAAPFLHDGRAETLEQAIEMHGGEAQASRDAFVGLTEVERAEIIEFLEKL
ncbi:MAG: CxxC motif-containing protein (DUF1111 family) [Planctomycetota bacterium]|jgi:CxxC motif-containing protein (DUF1111 family)